MPSDAMAFDTLPVTVPVVAEPSMSAVTSPVFRWPWRAMVTGP
jgi:hypothetical protein